MGKYLVMSWHIKKLTLAEALQYRINFALQILGTLIVDGAFLILWLIFFTKFPAIKNWEFEDTALLLAIGWFTYALNALFAGGIFRLSKIITQGSLDFYLVSPHHPLWQIAISRTELSAIGNILSMLIMFIASGPLSIQKVILFTGCSLISAGIFFNILVIVNSLTFFVGPFDVISQHITLLIYNFIYYPPVIFSGFLKIITYTIIPAYFIGYLPTYLIKEFRWSLFIIFVCYWFITFILSLFLFNEGLKRYESGNILQIRS